MLSLSPDQSQMFATAVRGAAGRLEVRQGVANLYEYLQNAIDLRRPVCTASGRCCRFEEFGHSLFITTLEMAAFIGQLPRPIDLSGWNGRGCIYQIDGLCSVHTIRPFGCRVFFCDASSTEWQSQQYEFMHGELKKLHEALGVPYYYVEWRAALRAVALSDTTNQADAGL